jgi:rare lipoprotein A
LRYSFFHSFCLACLCFGALVPAQSVCSAERENASEPVDRGGEREGDVMPGLRVPLSGGLEDPEKDSADASDAASAASFETGLASWYGPGFHRRRTASGERFDMHALTAAHRTLPFGTLVCVRSQATGRDVVVRINDRGPHVANRVLDLSRGAALALGMGGLGLKPVDVFPLGEGEDTCPPKRGD